MRVRTVLAITTCLMVLPLAYGQLVDLDPDWKELDVKPPTAFRTDKLVPIDMPRHVSVKVGIDPDTVTISDDGIVRYVVVAVSGSGSINAAYEGIWCRAGEVKTYARAGNDRQWNLVADPQWKGLTSSQPSMHALALARQGVCNGRSAAGHSPQDIVRKLTQSGSHSDQR